MGKLCAHRVCAHYCHFPASPKTVAARLGGGCVSAALLLVGGEDSQAKLSHGGIGDPGDELISDSGLLIPLFFWLSLRFRQKGVTHTVDFFAVDSVFMEQSRTL